MASARSQAKAAAAIIATAQKHGAQVVGIAPGQGMQITLGVGPGGGMVVGSGSSDPPPFDGVYEAPLGRWLQGLGFQWAAGEFATPDNLSLRLSHNHLLGSPWGVDLALFASRWFKRLDLCVWQLAPLALLWVRWHVDKVLDEDDVVAAMSWLVAAPPLREPARAAELLVLLTMVRDPLPLRALVGARP